MISRQLFNWTKKKRIRNYTLEEVENLIVEIKKFNAGVIDKYLDAHVDEAFEEWRRKLENC